MTAAIRPPEWMQRALCAEVDLDLFFPEKGGSTKEAKSICARCPVRALCLAFALEAGERYGIFGGKSERERRKIAREHPVRKVCTRCRTARVAMSQGHLCVDCQVRARAEAVDRCRDDVAS